MLNANMTCRQASCTGGLVDCSCRLWKMKALGAQGTLPGQVEHRHEDAEVPAARPAQAIRCGLLTCSSVGLCICSPVSSGSGCRHGQTRETWPLEIHMRGGQVTTGEALFGMAEDTQCRSEQARCCQGEGCECYDDEHLAASMSGLEYAAQSSSGAQEGRRLESHQQQGMSA